MIISLDTETTGLDLAHGAMPFLVTWCELDHDPCFIEWDVDPVTRRPDVHQEDVWLITRLLDSADTIYLHNAKFDARALATIGIELPWHKVRDTLVASHLLATNHPHNLTDLCVTYLGADIEPLEVSVKGVTRIARTIARREYPAWRIAEEGAEGMPSVRGSSKRDEDKPWKNDMWLPRALAKGGCSQYIPQHWLTACSEYACGDSEHTLYLGIELERLIRERGYWAVYEKHRLHMPRVACEMERRGVTVIGDYTECTIAEYGQFCAEAASELCAIASEYGHDLELAEGAALNDNMRDFFYGVEHLVCPRCDYRKRIKHWNNETVPDNSTCPKCAKPSRKRAGATHLLQKQSRPNLNLPVIIGKKTGNATLDKDAMQDYLTTLDGPALDFIRILSDKRKHDTDLGYMESYRRFWVPVEGAIGYWRIHPSLNPCGTDHLRWASNSPNLQNVGGQEEKCGECDGDGCAWCHGTGKTRMSVKNCFGPAPGRESWTMDYKSIEPRIPAYEADEPKMVEVFENPNQPPYWGNLYNLTSTVLYPDEYWPLAETEGEFRKRYPRLYKQAKFFVLAKNYGAGRRKGDLLSKVKNSYDLVDNEFPRLAALQAKYLRDAERVGYVETLPDRSVDPTRGYPILASRTEDGRVLSTTPFNYHVSGTACWAKNAALIRCSAQLAEWRRDGFDAHMCLEVHDEIMFDFPKGATEDENLGRAMVLRKLMEQSGEDLVPRIPTPVSVELHTETWARGISF